MRRALFLVLVVAPACGGDDGKTVDAGPVTLQGEYVDWDSTEADFCGIPGATIVTATAGTTENTPPNGRLNIDMAAGETRLTITPPTDATDCGGLYSTPGILIIEPTIVAAGVEYSIRSFTDTRRDDFFTSLGLTYDASKAQVFVNVHASSAPSIAADHDAPAAYDGSTWAAGGNGEYVFFPNVDPVGESTTLGDQTLPLAAGVITYAATN